jgi:phosphatidate cytidylyltransferase
MGYLVFAILGALCALVSVCGDLLASLIKRHYGIKDYGFIFPGHGGVMDRFDSVIAVAPVLYILVFVLSEFGIFTSSLF